MDTQIIANLDSRIESTNSQNQIGHLKSKFVADEAPIPKDLKELIDLLHEAFESDSANVDYIKKILSNYKSNPKDWRQYAKYDPYK
jgi:hypothetical protein